MKIILFVVVFVYLFLKSEEGGPCLNFSIASRGNVSKFLVY